MSSIIKNDPFHLQVYNVLRKQIIMSQKKPGERLQELKISEELEVSRGPVREALRMLEQEGLVVNSEHGLIVYPMELSDIEEVYQCRMATEPYAAYLAAPRMHEKHIKYLIDLNNEAYECYLREDYDAVAELTTKFHDSIINTCENKRLTDINQRLRSLIIMSRNIEFKMSRPRDFVEEHHEIIAAIRNRDPEVVEKILRKHIEKDWKHFLFNYRDSQQPMQKK